MTDVWPVEARSEPGSGRSHTNRRQRAWLPPCVLLLALSTLFAFGGDRAHFYRPWTHDWISVTDLALADSLFAKPFRFFAAHRGEDGRLNYIVYNRRPIGVFALIKLAIRPFEGDMSAQIFAARWWRRCLVAMRCCELALLKTRCVPADTAGRFLAHVVPVDVEDLPAVRRRLRFDNLDSTSSNGAECGSTTSMVKLPLPKYPITTLRVGRLGGLARGNPRRRATSTCTWTTATAGR